jgi:predicted cupin superfamily sugar epimerase
MRASSNQNRRRGGDRHAGVRAADRGARTLCRPGPRARLLTTSAAAQGVPMSAQHETVPRAPDRDELIAVLGLVRGTCGFMATSYRSPLEVAPPGAAPRSLGQALYFVVTPDARVRLHRIRSDQIYHHYAGDPLEVLLFPDGAEPHRAVVGPDLAAGHRPQLLIPGGAFHTARVLPGGTCALLGTTSWPAVAEGEFEEGDAAVLAARHPDLAGLLREFLG